MTPTIIAAVILVALAVAAVAGPIEGTWQTARDDDGNLGFVETAPCGSAFCGTLTQGFDPDDQPTAEGPSLGHQIVWDMVA